MNNKQMFTLVFVLVTGLAGGIAYGLLRGGELKQLHFVVGVLACFAYIFVISIAAYMWGPAAQGQSDPPGKLIFDTTAKVLAPLAALVIGYYFGTHEIAKTDTIKAPQAQAAPAKPIAR